MMTERRLAVLDVLAIRDSVNRLLPYGGWILNGDELVGRIRVAVTIKALDEIERIYRKDNSDYEAVECEHCGRWILGQVDYRKHEAQCEPDPCCDKCGYEDCRCGRDDEPDNTRTLGLSGMF